MIRKAWPIFFLFIFNFIIILAGTPLLYFVNISIYRIMFPIIGRFLTTLLEVIISTTAVLAWIYIWRLIYYGIFNKQLKRLSGKQSINKG